MAPNLSTLAPMCLVALALAGCSVDAVTAAKAATAGQQATQAGQQAKADAAKAPAQANAQAQASGQGTGAAPAAPKKPAPPAAPATDENADAAAGAAGGTVLAGSDGASSYDDTPNQGIAAGEPAPGTNQGIAVGEPAPGSQPNGRLIARDADPNACTTAFVNADANGDARLDLAEWQTTAKAGGAEDFKALDANKDGAVDQAEYGCTLQ